MKNKLSQILDIAFKMASLERYSQTHLAKTESVLEHTGFVCLLSYYLGTELIQEGHPVDMGLLLRKAVTHDIDEIITGDIPRPTKYYNEGVREALQEVERENMKHISDCLDNQYIYHDWDGAKIGPEGCIVAICDSMAVVYKAFYECIMLGNKSIADHVAGAPTHLDQLHVRSKSYFPESEVLQSKIQEAKIVCAEITRETK